MQLITTYRGSEFPFEGDRTLWLRCLPQHAQVQTARLTVAPALRPGADEPSFAELLDFRANQPLEARWGATIRSGSGFAEIDFGTRRTLVSIAGTGLSGATLQVDLGGIYVPISNAGTVLANGGTPFQLAVTNGVAELPGLTVNKFKLMSGNAMTISQINVRSVPSTITSRIGTQPTFWVRPGELSYAADSPDFADLLNIALTEAEIEDGFYQLPLVIHSDALCRLDVTLTVDYFIEQPVLPPHLPSVLVPYNYSSLPGIQDNLLRVDLPRGAVPITGRTSAEVVGQFKDTRVAWAWDELGELPDASFAVKVSPQLSLAQPLIVDREIQVLGIDLPMDRATPGLSGLSIAVQEDHDGKPSGTILVTAALVIQKPLPEQTIWASAALDSPFRIEPNKRYWLVLQSQVNEADWLTTYAGEWMEPLQVTTNNGFSWRVLNQPEAQSTVHALFRLRNKPEQFSIPLWLRLGKRPATLRRLDEFAPLGKIEFNFDFAEKLQEHLDMLTNDTEPDGAGECGTEELLINESFVYPPPDDASIRLFGVHSTRISATQEDENGNPIVGIVGSVDLRQGVDLSHQRSITLQLGLQLVEKLDDDTTSTVRHTVDLQARINCAGIAPTRTTISEIVQRINTVFRQKALDDIKDTPALQPFAALLQTLEVADEQTRVGGGEQQIPTGRLIIRVGEVASVFVSGEGDPPIPSLTRSVQITNAQLIPWCDKIMPAGWRGSGRHIIRLRFSDTTGRLAAVLIHPVYRAQIQQLRANYAGCIDPPLESELADLEARITQRVGVRDQCTYLFRLVYVFAPLQLRPTADGAIRGGNPQSVGMAPFWEIAWADAANRLLRTDTDSLEDAIPVGATDFLVFERPLHPPAGAVSAEVRIIYPFDQVGLLAVERASFMPTNLRVRNSYFQYFDQATHTFTGWETQHGLVAPDPLSTTAHPLLDGAGPDDAVLAQQLAIDGGAAYEFRVNAQPRSITAANPQTLPISQRARVELCWLAAGRCIEMVTLVLDELGFSERVWAGKAPPDATDAEIRLIQPRSGGSLVVEYAELLAVDNIRVPLYFLAEAPGELVVSKMKVTYDPPQSAQPMLTPARDEVQPTLSSRSDAAPSLFKPGISVTGDGNDDCEGCGDDEDADSTAQIPLTAVSRIGPVRAGLLAEVGIDSVRKLSTSDAVTIQNALKQSGGFTEAMAHEVVNDARRLIREAEEPTNEHQ